MAVLSGFEEFPSWVKPTRHRPLPVHVKALDEPLIGAPAVGELNQGKSDFWEMALVTTAITAREAHQLMAWANKVGLYGQCAVKPPDFFAPGADGLRQAMANGAVNGAAQEGKELITDGWPAGVLVLADGQFCQVGQQLFHATENINSDGAGNATLKLWPAIRTAFADDAVVDVNTPFLHALLAAMPELDTNEIRFQEPLAFAFLEKL